MVGIKVNFLGACFFLAMSLSGCRKQTACEEAAVIECEKTRETIEYFNREGESQSYVMEDCLKLIPLRCPQQGL